MSLQIFWTDEAKETFDAIFVFILENLVNNQQKSF